MNRKHTKPHPKLNAKPNGPQTWREQAEKFAGQNVGAIAANLGLPAEAFNGSLPTMLLGYTEFGTKDGAGSWVGAVTFPMCDGMKEPSGILKRLDIPIADTHKYSMPGSKLGLILGLEWSTRAGALFIVEGGSDTVALALCGLAAIGRPSNVTGAELLAELLADFPPGRRIIVIGENDQKPDGKWPGKEGVDAVAPKLAAMLGRPVLAAFPPDGIKDCRDWTRELLAGQAEGLDMAAVGTVIREHFEANATEATASTDTPEAAKSEPLPIIYFDEIEPVLHTTDFVEGILNDGSMSVIYGESGCGKTFFTLDLALHVAAGLPWREREVDRGAVLYLALEGSHGIRNRMAAFKASSPLVGRPLIAVVPVSVNLLDPAADAGRVIEAAKTAAAKMEQAVRLIVVDTLSRAMAGGNENSPEDMTAFVGNIDRIRHALPAHVAVVHHSGKDVARGARGHNSLRAATDTEIEVSRDPETRITIAKVTKQRDLESEGMKIPFKLESVTLGTNHRGKPVTSCVVRPASLDEAASEAADHAEAGRLEKARRKTLHEEAQVLLAIDAECTKHPAATVTAIRSRTGYGMPKVKETLEGLTEAGAVEEIEFTKAAGQGAKVNAKGFRRRVQTEPQ